MRELAEERRGPDHTAKDAAPRDPGKTSASSQDAADSGPTAYASPGFWPGAPSEGGSSDVTVVAGSQELETDQSADETGSTDEADDHGDGHDHGDDLKLAAAAPGGGEAAAPAKEGCACGTCDACDAKKKGGGAPAPAAPPASADPGKGVFFDDARTNLKKSVPIDKGGDKWQSIFSAALSDVPGDLQPDKLAARGEVQLTKCQQSDVDKHECKRVTPFTPEYKTKLILADDANATDGPVVTDGGKPMSCNDDEHHCTTSVKEKTKDAGNAKRVNLVVAAGTSSSKVNSKDTMHVDKDHGGVAVTRWFAGSPPTGGHAKGKRVMKKPVAAQDKRHAHVTLQAVLHDVLPGDVVSADAKLKVKAIKGPGGQGNCHGARDPLISHQIFASKKKDALNSKLASLTMQNGVNVKLGQSRAFEKSGAAQMPGTTPTTIYVSVVSWGGRTCSAKGDKWQVTGGHLSVEKRRG